MTFGRRPQRLSGSVSSTHSQAACPPAPGVSSRLSGGVLAGTAPCPSSLASNGSSGDIGDSLDREISILKRVNHRHIVRLLEVINDPQHDIVYMVMELLRHGPVMDMCKPETITQFSERRACTYTRQIILALEYLHAERIVHRDVKPSNLLLQSEHCIKLTDFGTAHYFSEPETDFKLSHTAGTPAFLAPECVAADGAAFDTRAVDLWATGVTLYCFLFGRTPYRGSTAYDIYQKVAQEPVPLTHVPRDKPLSAQALHLLNRMLQKDVSQRATIDQLRNDPWLTRFGTELMPDKTVNLADTGDAGTTSRGSSRPTSRILSGAELNLSLHGSGNDITALPAGPTSTLSSMALRKASSNNVAAVAAASRPQLRISGSFDGLGGGVSAPARRGTIAAIVVAKGMLRRRSFARPSFLAPRPAYSAASSQSTSSRSSRTGVLSSRPAPAVRRRTPETVVVPASAPVTDRHKGAVFFGATKAADVPVATVPAKPLLLSAEVQQPAGRVRSRCHSDSGGRPRSETMELLREEKAKLAAVVQDASLCAGTLVEEDGALSHDGSKVSLGTDDGSEPWASPLVVIPAPASNYSSDKTTVSPSAMCLHDDPLLALEAALTDDADSGLGHSSGELKLCPPPSGAVKTGSELYPRSGLNTVVEAKVTILSSPNSVGETMRALQEQQDAHVEQALAHDRPVRAPHYKYAQAQRNQRKLHLLQDRLTEGKVSQL